MQRTSFFLLYSVEQRTSHWHWWLLCAAACPASRDIDNQVTAWKFRCPFSPNFVFPRKGTYSETNFSAGWIVLHLESAIWHRSKTRFRDSQGGIKTLDDKYFGSRPLCLIFFICSASDHIWNTKKSCRKKTFLSFIVLPLKNSLPLCRKPLETRAIATWSSTRSGRTLLPDLTYSRKSGPTPPPPSPFPYILKKESV